MNPEYQYIIVILAGLLMGLVSEIGGAGSLIALPMLISVGLPPVVANGTNRVGVMSLYAMAFAEFKRGHSRVWVRQGLILSVPLILGTLAGAIFAVRVNNIYVDWLIVGTSVVVVVVDAFTPVLTQDAKADKTPAKSGKIKGYVILFFVGLYCGLVQSAMGYIIYLVLVTRFRAELRVAQGLKYFLSMIVTPIALLVFVVGGHVDWQMGAFLALGAGVGGWYGAKINQSFGAEVTKHLYLMALVAAVIYLMIFIDINIPRGIFEI